MLRAAIVSVLCIAATAPTARPEYLAPLYPNAVPCAPERSQHGCFLSKDSFDQVRAYYLGQRGSVTSEGNHPETGRKAFFEYLSAAEVHRYDPVGSAIGVRVYSKPEPDPGMPEVALPVVGEPFGKLKMMMMRHGNSDPAEYETLVKRYRPVAAWYFPESGDRSLRATLERCETSPAEQKAAEDMESLGKRAEALAMQGRMREAMALMQRIGQSAQGVHARSAGPEGAKKWKACLETLRENGYPTLIEIARDPSKQ